MTRLAFLFLFSSFIAHQAVAEELAAGALLSTCASNLTTSRDMCSAYILGVTQGLGLGASLQKEKRMPCIPEDVSETELVEIFKRHAFALKQKYPSDMDLTAAGIVAASIARNFPCRK